MQFKDEADRLILLEALALLLDSQYHNYTISDHLTPDEEKISRISKLAFIVAKVI
jgi:hypothetical protein